MNGNNNAPAPPAPQQNVNLDTANDTFIACFVKRGDTSGTVQVLSDGKLHQLDYALMLLQTAMAILMQMNQETEKSAIIDPFAGIRAVKRS